MHKRSFIYVFLLIMFSACNPVKTIYIDQELPPLNKLPENVQRIGFINRVTRDKTPGVTMDSDFLYFGESRDGSNASLAALFSAFEKTAAYECVLFQTDMPLTGIEEMPEAIAPTQIQQICENMNLDMVISMEYFRAIFDKDVEETTTEGYDQMTESSTTVFVATLHARMDAAFRVYIPGQTELFDIYNMGEYLTFTAEGSSKKDARQNLTKKRDAVIDWGTNFGKSYANRFTPRTFKTMRMICKGGDKRLKEAFNYAKEGNWEQAEPLWKSLENSSDVKLHSFALFNLALMAELNGDLIKASSLLKEAAAIYSFKELERYQRIINTKLEVQN